MTSIITFIARYQNITSWLPDLADMGRTGGYNTMADAQSYNDRRKHLRLLIY